MEWWCSHANSGFPGKKKKINSKHNEAVWCRKEDNRKVVCYEQSLCKAAYSAANNRSWEGKDSRGGRWEAASVRLSRRSSSSLPEARQLINSQLGACFPTKVGIKIRKTVSFSFTYGTVTMREKGDTKGCESLFLTSSFAPNISKAREL